MADIAYKAAPTASRFHRSNAFVRVLRGPIGTGKSVTCCMEIIRRGREQAPFEGVRRTRWAAIRNTYPELTSTTIKTWDDWAPGAVTVYSAPIVSTFMRQLPDGTRVEIEVLFLSVDRPADVKKLKSLDLTGVWLNEGSELAEAVFDMTTGRVGRFPGMAMGGSTWSGVIMDTNSPDDDHWIYELEQSPPEGYAFFAQPGALLKQADGAYAPNPAAENVQNHQLGYDYWLRQVPGKTEQWIRVYLLGLYGSVHDGKPVYPEWNETLHSREIYPAQGVRLVIGVDFGLTPAAVITQLDARAPASRRAAIDAEFKPRLEEIESKRRQIEQDFGSLREKFGLPAASGSRTAQADTRAEPAKAQQKTISALPEGAKQIGTSGGKPVYQLPDGRRFIQQ